MASAVDASLMEGDALQRDSYRMTVTTQRHAIAREEYPGLPRNR